MSNISGVLYEYLQFVQTYIAPPIAAVFITGIMHKRINTQGAYVTLISGFIIGFGRIFFEIMSDSLNPGSFLHTFGTMNYLKFGSWFFLLCVLLITVVSLATEEPKPEKVLNLTLGTVSSEEKKIARASFD